MTHPAPSARALDLLPLDALRVNPANPKRHDLPTIDSSVGRLGYVEPVVVDARTGYLVSGHGRRTALMAMRARGDEPPEGIERADDGTWLVPAVTGWASRSDAEANAALVALNRTTETGGWDDTALLDLLDSFDDFTGIGYDADDVESLRQRLAQVEHEYEQQRSLERGAAQRGTARTLPLDLIFSTSSGPSFAEGQMAMRLGWGVGVLSKAASAAQRFYERYPRAQRLAFMDNEWHEYDHDAHVAGVAALGPKYATTRDLLTREQADAAGVEWYSLEQTLDMAHEVAEHADEVILIPKYDCLDDLPEQFVLGYSVPSSYGGTPLPPEAFEGRRVHLLGGPWRSQRALLNVLGDDVVSLDNNHVLLSAKYGQVCFGDGSMGNVADLLGAPQHRTFFAALVLSLSTIATAVSEEYGVDLLPLPNDPDDVPVEESLDADAPPSWH